MFKRATQPDVKWCVNCRFWTSEEGMPAAGTPESYAQCRRFPPVPIVNSEPMKIALKERKYETPYIPENSWIPIERWPLTKNTHWCGEWAFPNRDDSERLFAFQKSQQQ